MALNVFLLVTVTSHRDGSSSLLTVLWRPAQICVPHFHATPSVPSRPEARDRNEGEDNEKKLEKRLCSVYARTLLTHAT